MTNNVIHLPHPITGEPVELAVPDCDYFERRGTLFIISPERPEHTRVAISVEDPPPVWLPIIAAVAESWWNSKRIQHDLATGWKTTLHINSDKWRKHDELVGIVQNWRIFTSKPKEAAQ